ncbi:MAG: hypothetical protein AUF79_15035 [Crenarchaeota archaeon 13_1_20CM_2_51_8]|nr:MAG: hypothetical protein AUF79_15035 [Crenarchaeota archaeon 13_1_20CM_2_51_8]
MVVTIMILASRLLMLLLVSGAVLAAAPIYTVSAAKCNSDFQVTISPTSETITRGSNLLFYIIPTGHQCLTGIHVTVGTTISPNVKNGPVLTEHSYDTSINNGEIILTGTTTSSTPTGTYTINATATGIQYPIVGQSHSGITTLVVTK